MARATITYRDNSGEESSFLMGYDDSTDDTDANPASSTLLAQIANITNGDWVRSTKSSEVASNSTVAPDASSARELKWRFRYEYTVLGYTRTGVNTAPCADPTKQAAGSDQLNATDFAALKTVWDAKYRHPTYNVATTLVAVELVGRSRL